MDVIIIDGLSFALPLFVIAIGGIYSEKSGVTNLALEGLQGMGAFCGALVAVLTAGLFASTSSLPFYLALIFAAIGGGIYAMLHALLCVRFKANQVISGVVINILAVALTSFLTIQINKSIFNKPSNNFTLSAILKWTVPGLSEIPFLGAFFRDIYPFEVIILVIAVVAWYVLYKTKYGMHLRACGDNPQAVDAAGLPVQRIRFSAVVISGFLAGIGGISFAYSISTQFSSAIYVGYGFLAIAGLIFGNWKILPTLGACLLFGFARSGGNRLIQVLAMPSSYKDLVMTLPYILTLLLLVFFSKSNRPPRALGESYDKGKR